MTKKEIKQALTTARETRIPQRVGRWVVKADRMHSEGIGRAWYWYYWARPDELKCWLYGVSHMDTIADDMLRTDRRGENFADEPEHTRAVV